MVTGDNTPTEGTTAEELELLRRQAVEDASFCLCVVLTWRYWLHKPAKRFAQAAHLDGQYGVHLMFTRETFLDIVVLCQVRILMVVLYREQFPKCRIFGDRFSSRFSEYIFQYARMAETNSPLFGMLGFKRHLKHFWPMVDMAADGNVKMPPSKRGVPNDISRVDLAKWAAPDGWHLTDEEICGILDAQMDQSIDSETGMHVGDCIYWWVNVLECEELLEPSLLERQDNFFSAPVKHFGVDDLWGPGVNCALPETGREDGIDADDCEVSVDAFDPTDEASAAAVFADACRQVEALQIDGAPPEEPETSVRQLYRSCCDATTRFNSDLVRHAQDRKFRFQVQKMFHDRGQEGDGVDKWDYYSEDDDVLMVVGGEADGPDVFVMVNVEELAVCNQVPPNKKDLTVGEAVRNATPRGRVPIDLTPDKVVLLARSYEEVDGRGHIIPGYQNKEHKHYHLPRLTDAPPAYWLSESALGHVRLEAVEKIQGRKISRMCKEKVKKDRKDLIEQHKRAP